MARDYIRWVPSVSLMKRIGRFHTLLYRATRGVLGARVDGLDILLLTTRGQKTGRLRVTPVPFFRNGDDVVLIASFGGNDRNPAWLGNLRRDPKVTVQYRGRVAAGEASVAEGEERERLWEAVCRDHPRYVEYQARTQRTIPVVVLTGTGI